MKPIKCLGQAIWTLLFTLTALPGFAADYPAPKESTWVVRDFRFHTGEVLPELRLHYTTVGEPTGEPVLILMDITVPMASLPTEMSGRKWMMRRLIIDSRRHSWRSTRPTTSAILRSWGCSIERSSA